MGIRQIDMGVLFTTHLALMLKISTTSPLRKACEKVVSFFNIIRTQLGCVVLDHMRALMFSTCGYQPHIEWCKQK